MSAPSASAPRPDRARLRRLVQRTAGQVQDHLAGLLSVSPGDRSRTVLAMLDANARRVPGYWIQLLLSTGIATLGLVLDSTAVVIGAMLVSPLMGPILELGMGFAVGSSLLLLRAALRVFVSIVWVVAGATVIIFLLPFHAVTAEVAARTAPTVLDLLVAIFCALTAVYTTIRPGSDTTAAAAGTAVGIALVPPLCATGFGLGTGSAAIASGATLLFVANLSGILVFSVACFLLLGYNQVEAAALEREYLERPETRVEHIARRVHQGLAELLGSRYGLAMRVLVPLFFLVAVYVPLRRALDDVAWRIRVRDEVRRILASDSTRAMQSSLGIEGRTVSLHLWMVGTRADAQILERQLETRIAAVAGVPPVVTVSAVPDAAALASASATAREVRGPALRLEQLRPRIDQAVRAAWPRQAAGPLGGWQFEIDSRGEAAVRLWHLGPPLGAAGEALLARAFAAELGAPLRIVDDPLPSERLIARRGAAAEWLATATRIVAITAASDSLISCVRGPGATDPATRDALRAASGTGERLVIDPARSWSVRVVAGSCRGG